MESVAGIKWNGWPEWNGIHGRDRLEYAIVTLFKNAGSIYIFNSRSPAVARRNYSSSEV